MSYYVYDNLFILFFLIFFLLPMKNFLFYFINMCSTYNGYPRRKWTRLLRMKSRTKLFAFYIALIPLRKVCIFLCLCFCVCLSLCLFLTLSLSLCIHMCVSACVRVYVGCLDIKFTFVHLHLFDFFCTSVDGEHIVTLQVTSHQY